MLEKEKRIVNIFNALGSPTRFKITKLLTECEMCTLDISKKLNKSISTVSKHLKILKDLDMIKFHTKGKYVIYSLKKTLSSRKKRQKTLHMTFKSILLILHS